MEIDGIMKSVKFHISGAFGDTEKMLGTNRRGMYIPNSNWDPDPEKKTYQTSVGIWD
jgi:hypothetical protein